jgi:hypothetical protein
VRLVVQRAVDQDEASRQAERLVWVPDDARYLNEFGDEVRRTCIGVLDVRRVFPADDSPDPASLPDGTEMYSAIVSRAQLRKIKGRLAGRK